MYNQELIDAVERLKALRIVKRDRDIVEQTGYSKGLISSYLSGKVQASDAFLKKFAEAYKQSLAAKPNGKELLQAAEEATHYKTKHNGRGTPYLGELDIFAGRTDIANVDLAEYITGHISIPGFKDADFFVNVRGSSMYARYAPGDMIAIKEVKDKSEIQFGSVYVVVTEENRVLKYVRKGSDDKHLLLKSENPKFDDYEILKKNVRAMFLVLGKITKDVL